MPTGLLLLSTLLALVSAVALSNHSSLTEGASECATLSTRVDSGLKLSDHLHMRFVLDLSKRARQNEACFQESFPFSAILSRSLC